MILANILSLFILINIISFILSGLPCSCGETESCLTNLTGSIENFLNVGEELWKETIPLQMGSRLYQLEGLKSNTSYGVKISYPASIPSRFSLLLTRGNSSLVQNWKRKLLNTEKLIFKTDNLEDKGEICVLVTMEPKGVVAIPNVEERKEVIFNTVCDELLLFIPQYAWWVLILVLLLFGFGCCDPTFPSVVLYENKAKPTICPSNYFKGFLNMMYVPCHVTLFRLVASRRCHS